ncbi:MAG: Na/Pi cotransporter family protein [Acholeplasmatales bacterium]|nr:Na/Pi cotransporter family protein [Acholeplasmatales bacterium]
MNVFSCILSLLAGCGVFMVGMNIMSHALESVCGVGVKRLLGKISNNRFLGVGIGTSVTAIVQSSSATTVMVIGLVNAGVITLFQATSIIMGANIGTTATGILASFSSFKLNEYFSIFVFIGVIMMFVKKSSVKNIGSILSGFGLIFIGLELMGNAFNNEEVLDFFMDVFSKISFPLLLILFGLLFTALLQSSSAMTGIVIVMAGGGALSLENALFIILGTNIGTCITAIISSIGANPNAKRASLIHLMFNVIGTVVFTIILLIFKNQIIDFMNNLNLKIEFKISLFHVVFNVVTTLLLLPSINLLVKFSKKVIKEPKDERLNSLKYIDDHLLRTPSVALMQAKNEIINMMELSKENFDDSLKLIMGEKIEVEEIEKKEDTIDYINNEIAKFLVALSNKLSSSQEKVIGSYFHVINDIERIGDHAINITKVYDNMLSDEVSFSSSALGEIKTMYDNVKEMYDISYNIFVNGDKNSFEILDNLEKKTDNMKEEMSAHHFARLMNDNCKLELTAYYTTLISNIERVGDHLVNIGYSVKNPTGTQED